MPLSVLKKYWGYDAFRPRQEDIVRSAIEQKDTLAILPTGGGKSICYQVPAMYLDGITIVVSPLIALMQDQVNQLLKRDIKATGIYSGLNRDTIHQILEQCTKAAYKLLYVSPERLGTELFQQYLPDLPISLVAIDEAHCISQWGHEFRPAYRKIADLRKTLKNVPFMALTASATLQVQDDIKEQLQLHNPNIFTQSIKRKNLSYHVRYSEKKPTDMLQILKAVPGSGIVYCRTRKRCVENAIVLKNANLESGVYHAGMPKNERDFVQQKWTESKAMKICATNAFGMGIDKPDVRIVTHFDAPYSLEAYYQEAGRAGRDGNRAYAAILFNDTDINKLQESIDVNYPPEAFIRKVYNDVLNYLKIPINSGYESILAFDVTAFAEKLKLPLLPTISAINILEKEEFWQWNISEGTQHSVRFTTDRTTLDYLAKNEPKLAEVTTTLLRMYGSIFYFHTPIHLYDVYKRLGINEQLLIAMLQQLHARGVIDYTPAIKGSTLFLLCNRVADKFFNINTKRIALLRKAHKEKIESMIGFLQNTDICFDIYLAKYFGEKNTAPCGKCDVCIAKKNPKSSDEAIEKLLQPLINQQNEIYLSDINRIAGNIPQEQIINYLRKRNDEGLCTIDAVKGIVVWKYSS